MRVAQHIWGLCCCLSSATGNCFMLTNIILQWIELINQMSQSNYFLRFSKSKTQPQMSNFQLCLVNFIIVILVLTTRSLPNQDLSPSKQLDCQQISVANFVKYNLIVFIFSQTYIKKIIKFLGFQICAYFFSSFSGC